MADSHYGGFTRFELELEVSGKNKHPFTTESGRSTVDSDHQSNPPFSSLTAHPSLQFVQSLSNPVYLGHLASQKLLDDPEFVAYLAYLQYFAEPKYLKYLL